MVKFIIWLVVEPYPSEKYEFVNRKDIWNGKKNMFQTTTQILILMVHRDFMLVSDFMEFNRDFMVISCWLNGT